MIGAFAAQLTVRQIAQLVRRAGGDPARVRARVDDPRISPRPAFHYRLPDANLGQADWSVCLEWNRWLVVERLAENRPLLERMAADYIAHAALGGLRDWPLRCSQWLILSAEPVR